MPLELSDCQFVGPALPDPFVRFELEKELTSRKLVAKTTGGEGKHLRARWDVYRRHLQELAASGGPLRVCNRVIEPLIELLGYKSIEAAENVQTREDREPGGNLLFSANRESKVRVWTTPFNEDIEAPAKRGRAYRFSHLRIAQRVLLTSGERLGLLTNGVELRLLISDPARPDSQVIIPLDPGWKRHREIPDSFLLLLALASPDGVKSLPDIVDKARLQQARVTKELREQAREAVKGFVQEIIDQPENRSWFVSHPDRDALARDLWHEGLITIYRLLFILKLESNDDSARVFSFASTSLWRNTFSPNTALAPYVRDIVENGAETGRFLESALRSLFRMFEKGLESTELMVKPLGGKLFGEAATPTLTPLHWGERAVALLLDRLLWTSRKRGAETRDRVHYGSLDVEDLGRVYEALLELEPGITSVPMCRLRRQKLEVVVPAAQGEKYRRAGAVVASQEVDEELDSPDVEEEVEDEKPARGKKAKVEWIEEIPPDRFFLRVGLGRKASGSYYTPHSFVRFLVQETLGPQVAERSPPNDPNPPEILKLKVLDPAMGSGHFLVEACRYLAEKLYEACRLCDGKAAEAEQRAEAAKSDEARDAALEQTRLYLDRVIDLPDPDDELLKYLPTRSPEGEERGVSQQKAEALCRRLIATHCLYGVDKNPLAVELAKLAIWLESHAEGMPLTFLDHRLVVGDSLTGPFWDKLLFRPGKVTEPVENLFSQGIYVKLQRALTEALVLVRRLEASVGSSLAELTEKEALKAKLDKALLPFQVAAAAWSGGVMLGSEKCDDLAYAQLLKAIGDSGRIPTTIESEALVAQIARGLGLPSIPKDRQGLEAAVTSPGAVSALSYDLTFPEVFYPLGVPHGMQGFHAALGNPPWDAIKFNSKEFLATFDIGIMDAPTQRERAAIEQRLAADEKCGPHFDFYKEHIEQQKRANDVLYVFQKVQVEGDLAGRQVDAFRVFMERNAQLLRAHGWTGVIVPSAFHANEGATGVRQLYLEHMGLRCCFSFENRRKLFEIDSRYKFATIVAEAGTTTLEFASAFYLHDDEWLFSSRENRPTFVYTYDFVKKTGGECLTFLELTDPRDAAITTRLYGRGERFLLTCQRIGIRLQKQPVALDMTKESSRFRDLRTLLEGGRDPRLPDVRNELLNKLAFYLCEGKTFHQFDETWGDVPRYAVPLAELDGNELWVSNARFFRLAFRAISSSTNERTCIFCLLSPPTVFGNSAAVEREPQAVSRSKALVLMGLCNTYSFDWAVRIMTRANVNLFIINNAPLPPITDIEGLIVHASIRLTSAHIGYAPLWTDQLGKVWREPGKPRFTWPLLANEHERWQVRAGVDAVVADAFGLSRDQYARVLSTFNHKSYLQAPALCLAMFDELTAIGLDAFTKKHDPYWDIPLNESLPQPVIELPIPQGGTEEPEGDVFVLQQQSHRADPKPRRSRRK